MTSECIDDLARDPRHRGALEGPDVLRAHGDNPFCGDALDIWVRLSPAGTIKDVRFDGYACSLCTAAAEALLDAVGGLPVEKARALSYDDLLELLGRPTVGRTRSGCVRLPLTLLARTLEER